MWKALWFHLMRYSGFCLEELRKITKNVRREGDKVSLPEFGPGCLPNMRPKVYFCRNVFDNEVVEDNVAMLLIISTGHHMCYFAAFRWASWTRSSVME